MVFRLPKYGCQKRKGSPDKAKVYVGKKGKALFGTEVIYLEGDYGSPESQAHYDKVCQALLRGVRVNQAAIVSVGRLIVQYMNFAESYYVKNGEPTPEIANIKAAVRPWLELYRREAVSDFTVGKLKLVRDHMIAKRWVRKTVNRHIRRIVRILRWGVEEELVPVDVFRSCDVIRNLQKGRCELPENPDVPPADLNIVKAVQPFVSRQVWGMIRLQLATGMRPCEVRICRLCEIDQTNDVWVFRPDSHKTQHHGKTRHIHFSTLAQDIVREFWTHDPEEFLFSPRQAVGELHAQKRLNRQSPMTPSQLAREKLPNPSRSAGTHYTKDSYTRAIERGCLQVIPFPDNWRELSPQSRKAWKYENHFLASQLRHNFGTAMRAAIDLDAARIALGHSEKATTEIYAEADLEKAKQTARLFVGVEL